MNVKTIELDIENIRNVADKLSTYKLVAEIEAENYTPWWSGDFECKTHDPVSKTLVALPTTETLKGAIKWVLRATVASCGSWKSYKEVEQQLAPWFGGVVGGQSYDSLVRLEVNAETIGVYKPLDVYNVLRRVKELVDRLNVKFSGQRLFKRGRQAKLLDVLEALGWVAFWLSRGNKSEATKSVKSIIQTWVEKGKVDEALKIALPEVLQFYNEYRRYSWLFLLFTIPRIKLAIMGREDVDSIFERLPAPPHTVRLRIKVYVANRKNIDWKTIALLTIYALVYALEVRGLGRGTSRGFGRFMVNDIKVCDELREEKSHIETIKTLVKELHTAPKDAIQKLHSHLVTLASKLLCAKRGLSNGTNRLPNLSPNMVRVEVIHGVKHPCPYPIQFFTQLNGLTKHHVRNIIEALSAIGYATLKNTWKLAYCGQHQNICSSLGAGSSPVKLVGAGFHTWILGLPRWQKQKTGYASEEAFRRRPRGVECIEANQISTDSRLRRSSPIVLYPLLIGNTISVVVIAYKTLSDHAIMVRRMYHVGIHGRLKAARHRQVTPLTEIMRHTSIRGGDKVGCGLVNPAGVISPCNPPSVYNQIDQFINAVYDAALEFIVLVLR